MARPASSTADRHAPPPIPFAVICRVSDLCNYDCRYCYGIAATKTHIMPAATATCLMDKVMAHVPAERPVHFVWHGGEPLLAGTTFFAQIAAQAYPGRVVRHSIQTNGYFVTEDFARFCKSAGFQVGVSLDGPQSMHDRNRVTKSGKATFDRTIKAIEVLRDAGLKAGCVAVLSRQNIDRIDELYRFFKDLHCDFRINPILKAGSAEHVFQQVGIDPEDYGSAMCRLFDLWYYDDPDIVVEPFFTIIGNFISGTLWGCDYQGRCLSNIICANPDGNIYPCGRFAGDEEFRIGNILSEPLSDLFAKPLYRSLACRDASTVPGCKTCEFARVCNGGCMATAHMARGRIWDSDYYCQGRKTLFSHISACLQNDVTSGKESHDDKADL